ncbi:DUF3768 domain-containing protein [Croceicoccus hydrothermalis]|jgi:hypothetical protein|uniref:DUF3768 domain-containing protein n=1 Tax=Croceicoccus hydrothermalis TaxID=2867964 RepID=UPI001EFBFEC2|nr:DUF3768 domain-containing protein [Croceicoccus hydrothermalis]
MTLAIDKLDRTEAIARLNDRARQGLDRQAGVVFTTNLLNKFSDGAHANDIIAQARIMKAMRRCTFSKDSPERDLSIFEVDGHRIMMKIDYYDPTLEWGSEDPTDASKTRRIITIMAPEDN